MQSSACSPPCSQVMPRWRVCWQIRCMPPAFIFHSRCKALFNRTECAGWLHVLPGFVRVAITPHQSYARTHTPLLVSVFAHSPCLYVKKQPRRKGCWVPEQSHQLGTDAVDPGKIIVVHGRRRQAVRQEALQQPPRMLQLHWLRLPLLFLLQAGVNALSAMRPL